MSFLPNELLQHTFAYFAVSDGGTNNQQDAKALASICLASWRLYRIAQPLLYGTIQLDIRSNKLDILLHTLKKRRELTATIKELYLECGPDFPARVQWMYRVRRFLQDLLPALTRLSVLKSNHRVCTTKLVELALYKQGNGYHMNAPSDLSNLHTLELFASDYVYKYNYILRLPRLRRVCLYSAKLVDVDNEDAVLPNDWGWTSPSIKELVFRSPHRVWSAPGSLRLRSNSLQALSRSLPRLESLRYEHFETVLNPWQCRALATFFAPQLAGNLRRLELRDGRLDASRVKLRTGVIQIPDMSVIDKIQSSNLDYLSLDWHTLVLEAVDAGPVDGLPPVSSPLKTLRHLTFRYAEANAEKLPPWIPESVLEHVQWRFPALEKIDLELKLRERADNALLQRYVKVFRSAGIELEVLEHNPSTRNTGSITCPGRPSTLSP
ncbi:hypothetical protein K458DRAFT_389826 [Lentithecium fluviatile CBS 122367]|uniref:F-box domain-containing protein n=1 Tax=Lentithecium fluviatile CBS 122367 TaxID=1168545 RepID=A0A6G1IZ29_9PLEO|nr:hypothetical protein K458DRAFT_389826 [Lentithecium fluviatile CBS 122367]